MKADAPRALMLGDTLNILSPIGYRGFFTAADVTHSNNPPVRGELVLHANKREPSLEDPAPSKPALRKRNHGMEILNLAVIAPAGAAAAPQKPGPAQLPPSQYTIIVPFPTTWCLNDVKEVASNLDEHGTVVQLVNAYGIPTLNTNGTADPNDDTWTLGGISGLEIERVAACGSVPKGFVDMGYGGVIENKQYKVWRADHNSGLRLDECGNATNSTDHIVAYLDDPMDGADIARRFDILLPVGFGDRAGHDMASHLAGQTITVTRRPTESQFNNRQAVSSRYVEIAVADDFDAGRRIQAPSFIEPARPRK